MAITATAGNATGSIAPRRPSWADMHTHYPGKEIETEELYTKIGNQFKGAHKHSWMENTCAVRMSYALLRSGFGLSRTSDPAASKLGADKRWYWLRVADLRAELVARFKGFDAELSFELLDTALAEDEDALTVQFEARKAKATEFFKTHLLSKNGIIVFKVEGWSNATGHFTLWDGTARKLAFANDHDDPQSRSFYPWLTTVGINKETKKKFLVQVQHIQFWELK
ncbi:type VI secretion system amidase effector protein Tae4 [Massilia sp. PAMC28688]|uniref:T6SS effector amidase Tae4 family protein n=1 Tax=Massilia sp. PAMC28688 TaxID=2861283 RepID=UPI001C6286FC|nr:T6SS effector amidase Tae4 family protein [Massilia sp. PAMC28688]QYF92255.1 type VI secretion system amidase effector protein Tae4 [Massilia sp. PAMC28688]